MNKNQILKSFGTEYKEMTKRLLDSAGFIQLVRSKSSGDNNISIGIKPNLVTPTPASFGATTHPEVVSGIIEVLKENGFHNITVLEGSWIGDKTKEAFEYCGYNELAGQYNVKIIDTQKDGSKRISSNGYELNICSCLDSIDFLINVPVLKGHCQTHMTCALKNLKGVIPNSEKKRFHTLGLHKPIAYLNSYIHQDFIVVDNICGDPDFEEGGNPVTRNCVMAALDPVLCDSYACSLLGLSPDDVEYVRLSEELGIGSSNLSKASVITVEGAPVNACHSSSHLLEVNYSAYEIDSCSACYSALTEALLKLENEGLLNNFEKKICIGQGYKSVSGENTRIGIGQCCSKFDLYVKGCPPTAEEIYTYLKEYIISHR